MIAANNDNDDRRDDDSVSGIKAASHSQSPLDPQPVDGESGRGELLTPDKKGMGLLNSALRRGFRLSRKLKHRAVMATDACLDSLDEDVRLGAVRAVIQMEQVNVSVDKEPAKHNHLHLHGSEQINVVFVDDWYGSKAANLAATDAASTKSVDQL